MAEEHKEAIRREHSCSDDPPAIDTIEQGAVLPDWTPKDEQKVVLKLDLYLLPLLLIAFFFLCLDRSNISNALTNNFTKDLHISTGQAALGNQLQLAGIVIFELPSSMLLPIFGARKVLLVQMTAWSLVATFQCFIKNKAQYFATRFLLGTFEGGFIPGAMYLMGDFYLGGEQSTRYAIYYFGNYFASGTGSLIAAGILKMDGVRGWPGWRWLFLIDGIMTLGFTMIVFLLLPAGPTNTRPIHGRFDIFTDKERHIMQSRLLIDNPEYRRDHVRGSPKLWLKAIGTPRLLMHFVINLVGLTPAGGLLLFAPTIVKTVGFGSIQANALVSVGYYAALVLAFLLSWFARWTRKNGVACFLPFLWSCIFAGVLYHIDLETHRSKWTLYALFMLILAAMLIEQPINNAWCSKNCRSPQERSVGLAMCVIGSNLGGLIGQQLFQTSDAPKYRHGFIAVFAIYAAAVVIVMVQIGLYWWLNRRMDQGRQRVGDEVPSSQRTGVQKWRFVL